MGFIVDSNEIFLGLGNLNCKRIPKDPMEMEQNDVQVGNG